MREQEHEPVPELHLLLEEHVDAVVQHVDGDHVLVLGVAGIALHANVQARLRRKKYAH